MIIDRVVDFSNNQKRGRFYEDGLNQILKHLIDSNKKCTLDEYNDLIRRNVPVFKSSEFDLHYFQDKSFTSRLR